MKILQLVNYPIDLPRHGGQIRCSKIRNFILDLGHEVKTVSVINGSEKTNLGPSLNIPTEFIIEQFGNGSQHVLSDLASHRFLMTKKGQELLRGTVGTDWPEVVLVEQPWLFEPIYSLLSSLGKRPKYIFSSQNVEHQIKSLILKSHNFLGFKDTKEIILEIEEVELFASKHANEVWGVTIEDLEFLCSKSAANRVLIPNGTDGKSNRSSTDTAESIPTPELTPGYALFVGSAYPPNFEGFTSMIGESCSFLPPDYRIVCVGSICQSLDLWIEKSKHHDLLRARIDLQGVVEEKRLAWLISRSDCILLPITVGGGSNLKTPEALSSGKKIIGTTRAFRGFENWLDTEGVIIKDDVKQFRYALSEHALLGDYSKTFERVSSSENPLLWEDALEAINKNSLAGVSK